MKQFFSATLLMAVTNFSIFAQSETGIESIVKEKKDSRRSLGFKLGYNVAKIAGNKSVNFAPDTKNGFTASLFFAPASKSLLGVRSEIIFSRQGFGFGEDGSLSTVTNDYLYLPQFTTLRITRFVQLHAGGQVGILLRSSQQSKNESGKVDIISVFNRIDYGAAFGLELYPFKGFILGGRYNIGMGDTFKQSSGSSNIPSPLPFNPSDVKGKNAVINFFVGYKF